MSKKIPELKVNNTALKNKRVALIKAEFNADITDKILALAIKELIKHDVKYDVFCVGGAFEIPYKINYLNKNNSKKYNGFVAIGCLIKGETDHYEYVSQAVSNGIMRLSISLTKPIMYAILNCQNRKQALSRIDNIEYIISNLLTLI
ncbi:MAG: 6,7-dimethyl-8-ribityllumazine synthase [Patescibacteria group bacterium]